jgi:putative membrane protein
VVSYQSCIDHGILSGFPSISPNSSANVFISTTTVALSLLMVFRTNAGYGRWDEARKMWGLLINRSRDVVRQGMTIIPPEDVESREALGRWMIAFARTFKMHCQPDEWSLREELGEVLKPREIEMLEKSNHR